jgi:basic membrane protein A
MALAISACGSSSSSSSSGSSKTPSGAGAGGVAVAQVSAANDHSFGQATHDGVLATEKQLGIKITEVDNLTAATAQLAALKDLARTNKLIIYSAAMSVTGVANKFPGTQFVALDGSAPPGANTHSQVQNWLEVSYLAGVAAAHQSKSHVIGFIGGIPIPAIATANKGYIAGAKSVDPSIKVISTDIGSFTDSVKGKSAAQAQIAQGADVLYADLDTAHTGIVEAAKESGKDVHVIGSIAPKCTISDGLDLGDTVFSESKIVLSLVKNFVDQHKLAPTLNFGLAGGYGAFPLCPGVSPAVSKAVATTAAGLTSGKIKP